MKSGICIELNQFHEWFSANKLSLNVKKTNFMLFSKANYRNRLNISDIRIFMNGESLQKVDCAKFLGVLIDDGLTWKSRIDFI